MTAAEPTEDVRFWQGLVASGREAEHEQFLTWLNSAEAHELFRRRRLREYALGQDDDRLTVVFKVPHTGDPRIVIDFLRYPGLWPEFWQYERGGVWEGPDLVAPRIFWRQGD